MVSSRGKVPPIPDEFAVPEDLRKLVQLCCVWRPESRISATEVVRILTSLTVTAEELSSKLARASIMVDSSAVLHDTHQIRSEGLRKQLRPSQQGTYRLGVGGAGEVILVEWSGILAAKKQLRTDACVFTLLKPLQQHSVTDFRFAS